MEKVQILVVDDDEMGAKILSRILSDAGYHISRAKNGNEALSILSRKPFDLVMTDLVMEKMDGLELLKQIKANHPRVGVIVMTGYADTFTIKDALLLGADEYISKPFQPYEVTMVVERAFWRMRSQKQVPKTE